MIEKLTPEQESRFPEFVEKWTAIGLSTEPLNYDAAVDAVNRAYRVAGLNPPQQFVVADSPVSGVIVTSMLSAKNSVTTSVRNSVRASVGDSVWNSVRASVGDSVWNNVRASVGDSVRNNVTTSVGDSVWNNVWASVWNNVRASVGDSVWNNVRASVEDSAYGAHDANWLAFYDYFRIVCALECTHKLIPLIDLAQHCGWWIPYKNLCILQHRHCELHRNDQGQLHNPHGMACKYPDGWGVYAYNGTRIPFDLAWIIEEPNKLEPQHIDDERNAELRRVMLEIMGHDQYIARKGLQPIDSSDYGELFRCEMSGDEPLVMVRVVDGTHANQRYMLRVPPDIDTAHEAVAWTFGMNTDEYVPIAQT